MDKRLMERMKKLMKNASVQQDNYNCPKCRDLGYIFVKNDNNNEVACPCECLAKKQAFEKLQKCGLSEVFKKKTFNTYTCSNQNQIQAKHKALVYCKEFLANNSSLILSGHSGTGKTFGHSCHVGTYKQKYKLQICRIQQHDNQLKTICHG